MHESGALFSRARGQDERSAVWQPVRFVAIRGDHLFRSAKRRDLEDRRSAFDVSCKGDVPTVGRESRVFLHLVLRVGQVSQGVAFHGLDPDIVARVGR